MGRDLLCESNQGYLAAGANWVICQFLHRSLTPAWIQLWKLVCSVLSMKRIWGKIWFFSENEFYEAVMTSGRCHEKLLGPEIRAQPPKTAAKSFSRPSKQLSIEFRSRFDRKINFPPSQSAKPLRTHVKRRKKTNCKLPNCPHLSN